MKYHHSAQELAIIIFNTKKTWPDRFTAAHKYPDWNGRL